MLGPAAMTDRQAPRATASRSPVVAALLVGLVLRVVWVCLIAAEPASTGSDTGRMLAMARQFADGETYRLNGLVSAFHPPGYSLLLTPVAWLSEATGWFSLPLGAGLVNAAAGTITIGCGAVLADRWFGRAAAVATAWVLALAPGHIFLTGVALTETAFTAFFLGALVVLTDARLAGRSPSRRWIVGLGAMIGFAFLIRGPGIVLAPIAALALYRSTRSWRSIGPLVAGVALLLVPWTVRNGVQVGIWSPGATNNAAFLCHGHGDHAVADIDDLTPALYEICFRGTPYDPDDPDEAGWYGPTTRDAVGWALTHPFEEVDLTIDKTTALFAGDRQSLSDARDFGRRRIASDRTTDALARTADVWHWAVLGLAAGGLVTLGTVRRRWALWASTGALVVTVWAGMAADRYHHTIMALLAVVAGAVLARLARPTGAMAGTAVVRSREMIRATATATAELMAPDPGEPERRFDRRSLGPAGPRLGLLTFGLTVPALAFDVIAVAAAEPVTYTRGAQVLTVAATLAAAISLLWLLRSRRSRQDRGGVTVAAVTSGALLASTVLRSAMPAAGDAFSPAAATGCIVIAVVSAWVSAVRADDR